MIIDIISDLHGTKPELKGGDLLILGGDYTARGTIEQWDSFFDWLSCQDYAKKVFIGGNHDNYLQLTLRSTPKHCDADYLCDSGTEFDGVKIWGSPWSAWFDGINPKCTAFTCKSDTELAKKWAKIPEDTDILITHSPPYGILDEAMHTHNYQSVGSRRLLDRVRVVRPKLHVFGHIHEGYGQQKDGCTHFVNASIMDVNYRPSNKPIRVKIQSSGAFNDTSRSPVISTEQSEP